MRSAVIVIDLQVGLFEVPGKPYAYANTIETINRLTAAARRNRMPVVFVQHEQVDGVLQYSSSGWALVPELEAGSSDHMVRKTTPNAFLRTRLHDLLHQEMIDSIIVAGYATEYCVDSTVRGAAALGYAVQLVADGHTTHDKEHAAAEFIRTHHNITLSNITSFGVPIQASPASEIIAQLDQTRQAG